MKDLTRIETPPRGVPNTGILRSDFCSERNSLSFFQPKQSGVTCTSVRINVGLGCVKDVHALALALNQTEVVEDRIRVNQSIALGDEITFAAGFNEIGRLPFQSPISQLR